MAVSEKERDAVTGTDLTGHVWDGIRELDTPLPKWWLYVLYATILWSIVYWILYPAWPGLSGYTRGLLGYSTRATYVQQSAAAADAQKVWLDRVSAASVDQIDSDSELIEFAQNGGHAVFAENCVPCHGAGGQGTADFPVLVDDSWLWGGDLANIEKTIRFGIRSTHADTRVSVMPRFGADKILEPAQIADVADYVLSLSGAEIDPIVTSRGRELYANNCLACHGDKGQGNIELGAPMLNDAIWQYGGDREDVIAQITLPKQGVMPTWQGRISDEWIKMVAIYVHNLGGGQ